MLADNEQAVALLCLLALLSFLATAADRRQRLVIYQSSAACMDVQHWANLSSRSAAGGSGVEILAVKVAPRSEAVIAAAVNESRNSSTLVYIEWRPDCVTNEALVTAMPGLTDVIFAAAASGTVRCSGTVNLLLSAALEYFHSRVGGASSDCALAIMDNCPASSGIRSGAAVVHLSREAGNYGNLLSNLLTDRRIAGFRHFFINWPMNLTEDGVRFILSGGWNETWFLLADEDGKADFLSANDSSFSRGVYNTWRTRIYRVAVESIPTEDAVLKLLTGFQSKTGDNNTAVYVDIQANAAIYSGGSSEKVATYMPNGSIAMETAAGNFSDPSSNQSQVVTVAFAQNPPFSFISDGHARGICIDILNLMSPILNISFVLQPIDNGTWDKVIRQLENKSVDLGSCDLSVTWQRSQLVDFSLPWSMEFKGAVIPVVRTGVDLFHIFRPFDSWVYLVTTLAIMLGGSVMAALAWLSPISLWNLHALHVTWSPATAYRDEVSVKQNVWTLFSALLHQGQDFYPNSASSRTVMFFWWMVSLILVATYTAAMVASLTVPEKASVPDSLEGLRQLGYEFLVPAGGSTQDLFDGAPPSSVYASIRDSGQLRFTDSFPYSLMAGGDRRIAFVSDRTKLSADVKDNCSSLVVTGVKVSPATLAFAVRRDVVWLDRFNRVLQLLLEKGFIEQLRLQYWTPSVICKSAEPNTLNLSHTAGIFVLFLIFCAAALAALSVELVSFSCGWAACRRVLAAGDKSHLGCLLSMVRGGPWAERRVRQLPEEFRNVRWRPETSGSGGNPQLPRPPPPMIVIDSPPV